MDATRERRIRDRARRAWYARHRQWRFARHLGFAGAGATKVGHETRLTIHCARIKQKPFRVPGPGSHLLNRAEAIRGWAAVRSPAFRAPSRCVMELWLSFGIGPSYLYHRHRAGRTATA